MFVILLLLAELTKGINGDCALTAFGRTMTLAGRGSLGQTDLTPITVTATGGTACAATFTLSVLGSVPISAVVGNNPPATAVNYAVTVAASGAGANLANLVFLRRFGNMAYYTSTVALANAGSTLTYTIQNGGSSSITLQYSV